MTRGFQLAAVLALLALPAGSSAQIAGRRAGEVQELDVLILDGAAVGEQVAPHAGEICMVCNNPIQQSDVTYLVRGQRVPVHRIICNGKLRENPRAVLAGLQPRGAFLGAEMEKQTDLSGRWFVFGLYVLLGLFFGALCAHCALTTGRNPVAWFFAGFLFNIVGYAALLSRPPRAMAPPAGIPPGLAKIASTRAPVVCPMCGRELHPSAAACSACGAALQPAAVSEVSLAARVN